MQPVRRIRKGAAEAMRAYVDQSGGKFPEKVSQAVEEISRSGGTPLVVAEGAEVLGVVQLKDVVKGGIKERFAQLRKMGIRTVMITGDNPLTAAAIAAEAGVDDFLAQATPEAKLKRIRQEQAAGHLVAMTGDGTNDAPALAQADVGVAMNTGTQAAREAGNMVDLDSNPTKLIEIVEIGKQLLITRGSLTTFSIANDVAKYFAIIPAMLMATFPAIAPLNIMHLHSPTSAILSAVIFNALIIIALIPLALRGVAYKPIGALGHPPAQPAYLWPGRRHHPLHRHQTHRYHHHRSATRMKRFLPKIGYRCKAVLINTPLQRGVTRTQAITNRFNGFFACGKTAEAVSRCLPDPATPLKRGVNGRAHVRIQIMHDQTGNIRH